jgi:hypothetical protein
MVFIVGLASFSCVVTFRELGGELISEDFFSFFQELLRQGILLFCPKYALKMMGFKCIFYFLVVGPYENGEAMKCKKEREDT